MAILGTRKDEWVFCGHFCEDHLKTVAKNYGTIKSFTLDPEQVNVDHRCMIMGCKAHIQFSVERKAE
jgi:hypothetical protein